MNRTTNRLVPQDVSFGSSNAMLDGTLTVPDGAIGVVAFAHGSGSGRYSPRNQAVARALNEAGLATLLFDLLTADEAALDESTGHYRFNISLLGQRLTGAVDWLGHDPRTRELPIGLFGASTGAAAALIGAAERPRSVGAVVSRGGRPDLAEGFLDRVEAPVLLIVGGRDPEVLRLNQQAQRGLRAQTRLEIVPGATHLFEEPGTLEQVMRLAAAWFTRYLAAHPARHDRGRS